MGMKPINKVVLCGTVCFEEQGYKVKEHTYYKAMLRVEESDGRQIYIPLRIRTDRVDKNDIDGKRVKLEGCLIQYYQKSIEKNCVDVKRVYASYDGESINRVTIVGEVSKPPKQQINYNGKPIVRFKLFKRNIGDFPVVVSGRNLAIAERCLNVGTVIRLSGRLYSHGKKNDVALSINGREISFLS